MGIINLDKKAFEELILEKKQTVIVDFTAPWCVYCRKIAPVYERLAEEYEGQLIFARVNTDEEPQLTEQQLIEVLPTFVLYKEGEAVDSIVAPASKSALEEVIGGR